MSEPDLDAASAAVDLATGAVQQVVATLAESGDPDRDQVLAYDLAHAAASVEAARAALAYGAHGELEGRMASAFIAEVIADLWGRLLGREALWGVAPEALEGARAFLATCRDPRFLADLADRQGPRHLTEDFELVAEVFRRFAEERIEPVAEHVHRANDDVPEDILAGLAELGAFGLSVPEAYGGNATGGEHDYLGMVVATEELSRGSLGIGGSLITRPEILTRALVKGGTEEQRHRLLPRLASGETMVAVAVTEPDRGSDVAGLTTTATRVPPGEPGAGGWRIRGTKTWCTFAGRADALMLLARTDPDRTLAHRGLSLFVIDKPRGEGHGFAFTQDPGPEDGPPGGGRLEGRAIDTIGYRGMHSYEVSFEDWWVPPEALVGGEDGLGRGFYLTMEGFENGRLQTAARALGVMQAAYEAARAYTAERIVFGQPVAAYQLTQVKLARMAVTIQACRQFAYRVAGLMAKGEGTTEASMVKAYACRAAEWVTREAMQLHGGMGYAEEYPVSRYFVDARVLSIFEGADETLALKVIARRLVRGRS
ncbi:MAG TPA: acyl-CoA dehydrogenase family protein [Acidimicrobiales bacterium]|nr:acyl-CoA dehydrogenase family protein [Acidimicrobiales bacterium]